MALTSMRGIVGRSIAVAKRVVRLESVLVLYGDFIALPPVCILHRLHQLVFPTVVLIVFRLDVRYDLVLFLIYLGLTIYRSKLTHASEFSTHQKELMLLLLELAAVK